MSNIEPTPFGDKYVLVEHIATGGMAEIYRANYTGIEGFAKELVVKRLREEFAERPDVVQMFLDEARVAATLTHNNVVHTYDLGELAGEYFIAMELLKGEELVAVLRRAVQTGSMIPWELSLGIVMQSLEGLHYAHSRSDDQGQPLGLVHRDINPTNIHVGYDGVCKIVDFGIAATRNTALTERAGGQFAGKLSYMAPEQVRGEDLDGRADLFALGVVLYEMCLGRRLFRGKAGEVKRRILEGDIPAPTFVMPDFPPGLEAVIMKALEVDRADRYQNADHMFRDLDAFMEESGWSWTPRRISAFMAELFGEGAPAQVDYEDLYDDLVDDVLDFDKFDRIGGDADAAEEAPDWVKELESGKGGKKKRRSMTIGNLEALVATPKKEEAPEAPAEAKPEPTSSRSSARHQRVKERPRDDDEAVGPRRGGAATSGSRPSPTTKSRPTASLTAAHSTLSGSSFGQTVMTEQSRKGGAVGIILAVVAVLGVVGWLLYWIMSQK